MATLLLRVPVVVSRIVARLATDVRMSPVIIRVLIGCPYTKTKWPDLVDIVVITSIF